MPVLVMTPTASTLHAAALHLSGRSQSEETLHEERTGRCTGVASDLDALVVVAASVWFQLRYLHIAHGSGDVGDRHVRRLNPTARNGCAFVHGDELWLHVAGRLHEHFTVDGAGWGSAPGIRPRRAAA